MTSTITIPGEIGNAAAGTVRFLTLAASPAFATMALITGVLDAGSPDVLCAATQHASSLSGMVPMYLLMSIFHTAPWLKLIAAPRRSREPPSRPRP